jgi:MoaA/NifB/PqqE/SkfB family radical SAM enzyme
MGYLLPFCYHCNERLPFGTTMACRSCYQRYGRGEPYICYKCARRIAFDYNGLCRPCYNIREREREKRDAIIKADLMQQQQGRCGWCHMRYSNNDSVNAAHLHLTGSRGEHILLCGACCIRHSMS